MPLLQNFNEVSSNEPWVLIPNPWYKGKNLNEPNAENTKNFLKSMLSEMNLNQRIEDWRSVQKRSPTPIGDCQTENGQARSRQRIYDLIH